MARQHGRKGKLYVDIAGGGSASPLPFQAKWTFSATTDTVEDTTFDDNNKVYLSGMPDAQGTFAGFYDDATPQTYTAAQDGIARKFYLYPNIVANPGQYWFGTAIFDFSASGGTAQGVDVSGNWKAASAIQKVG